MSYWSKIETKFKCIWFCNISNLVIEEENTENTTSKLLFSDKNIEIENYGCLFPMSKWFNNMILSFGSLVIINIVLSAICIYICIAILFDKVYEGSNYPQYFKNKNLSKSENKIISGVINGNPSKEKTINAKITN